MNQKEFSIFKNQELLFIMLYNLTTLVSYHLGGMNAMYVLWAYFLQSLFIGARYMFLEIYQQIRTKKYQWFLAGFFPVHYGGFHFVYFIFLLIMGGDSDLSGLVDVMKINFAILSVQFIIFVIRELSEYTPDHSPAFFFAPYVRIIPMHIVILLGFNTEFLGIYGFDIFILLKMFMDWVSYGWFDKKETQ